MSDEDRASGAPGASRSNPRNRYRRASTAFRQAVWLEVIEQIAALFADDRDVVDILGDAARCIHDAFGLRSAAIGIVDGPWIEYRGVATERLPIAHRLQRQPLADGSIAAPHLIAADAPGNDSLADDAPDLTPLIRLPIRAGGRTAAVLTVEVDPDHELDADDVDALTRVAQIIGFGLARTEFAITSLNGQAERPGSSRAFTSLSSLADVTPDFLAGVAADIGALAVRVIIDDWSGAGVISGRRDGLAVDEPPVARLLTVPGIRLARLERARTRIDDLAEEPAYDRASEPAGCGLVEPVLVAGEPAGVVIAEFGDGGAAGDVAGVAAHLAPLIAAEREHFNQRRVDQFVQVLDRAGQIGALGLDHDDAYEALASIVHEGLGFDAVYGEILDGRLYFRAAQQSSPLPPWLNEGIPLELGVAGRVALIGHGTFIPDVLESPDYLDTGNGALSEVCLPVHVNGEVTGAFNVESTARRMDELDAQLIRCAFTIVDGSTGVGAGEQPGRADPTQVLAAMPASPPEGEPTEPVAASGAVEIDPLTGLPDGSYFLDRLSDQLAAARTSGLPVSVLAIAAKGGSSGAEDSNGIPEGLVRDICERVVGRLRAEDLVSPFGDWLAVLLPNVNPAVSLLVARRLLDAIEGGPSQRVQPQIRCAIGAATSVTGEDLPEVLLARASAALELALKRGYGPIEHYREIEFSSTGQYPDQLDLR